LDVGDDDDDDDDDNNNNNNNNNSAVFLRDGERYNSASKFIFHIDLE